MIRIDGLLGKLKLLELPEKLCWTDPIALLKLIQTLFVVEFPGKPQDKFTIVGAATPGPDQTTQVWERLDRQGNYMGKHLFIENQWRRVYDFPLGARLLMDGTPTAQAFDGFVVTDEGIQLGGKTYFAVKWVGQ